MLSEGGSGIREVGIVGEISESDDRYSSYSFDDRSRGGYVAVTSEK